MQLGRNRLLALVSVCLFLSGGAGLVYEVVWARYLALFLGHTSYAVVAVLGAFMGGLALGNVAFGYLADRTTRPLAWYAYLEIGIGLYALVFPFYYELAHDLYLGAARGMNPEGAGLLALKFVFSLATILIPTVLMGGTLPLLTRLLTRSVSEVRANVAALYFVNSAGAVVGTWFADFVLIEAVGIEATGQVAAAVNLLVGLAALGVSSRMMEDVPLAPSAPPPAVSAGQAPDGEIFTPAELRLAVIGIGLSGFVAMLYQVAWTRLLALVLGSSTHAFALMLMTFIAGITVGSWIVYRWKNLRNALTAFAWTELALAGAIAASMFLYDLLPFWFSKLATSLNRSAGAYPLYSLVQGLICFAVMFVPTVCLGMTLPLVSRVATRETARTGRSVGAVFAVNTVGTVLGAVLTGLWLMPWLGLARTFALGVGLNAMIGLAILAQRHRWRGWWGAAPVGTVALVFAAGQYFNLSWPAAFTLGLWRSVEPPTSLAAYRKVLQNSPIVYYRDGAGATVSVHQPPTTETNLFLKVNGKTDASTLVDMSTQLLLGHVPMLLKPAATNALVIGLGSGITGAAMLAHPSLQSLEVIEISPEVIEASRWFAAFNRNLLDDPRVRVVVDDAKSYFGIHDRKYDVIVSEPSNPWMAGVAGVFSVEFYQSCREHLQRGGVMVQWVQLYEFSDAGLDMVLATFSRVFPHVSVWQCHRADMMLVGSADPFTVNLDQLIARFHEPAVKRDLSSIQIETPPVLLTHELISPEHAALVPPPETRIHSDFYPVLEFLAQRDFFSQRAVSRFRQMDENFSRRPTTLLGAYLRQKPLGADDFLAFARYFLSDQQPFLDLFSSLLARWRQISPDDLEPVELSTRVRFLSAPGELEVLRLAPYREAMMKQAERNPALLRSYGLALMRSYFEQRSAHYLPPVPERIEVLTRLIETDPDNQRVYQAYLAEMAWDVGDDEACLEIAKRAFANDLPRGAALFKLDPDIAPRVVGRLADIHLRRGNPTEAATLCQEAIRSGVYGERARANGLYFEVMHRKSLAAAERKIAVPQNPQ
ncbi:MAG: fused MFS/spermidine synthase [Verrucomicrobia bacterium]|nr:fused MFS/spermidine synthase [Verrucomicrobiota bacterium]